MSEQIEVTEQDRDAAHEMLIHLDIDRDVDTDDTYPLFFALHRQTAARAERELCVAILRQTVDSQTQMATNNIVSADFRKAYTYAASVLDSLLDQLTKGPTR